MPLTIPNCSHPPVLTLPYCPPRISQSQDTPPDRFRTPAHSPPKPQAARVRGSARPKRANARGMFPLVWFQSSGTADPPSLPPWSSGAKTVTSRPVTGTPRLLSQITMLRWWQDRNFSLSFAKPTAYYPSLSLRWQEKPKKDVRRNPEVCGCFKASRHRTPLLCVYYSRLRARRIPCTSPCDEQQKRYIVNGPLSFTNAKHSYHTMYGG